MPASSGMPAIPVPTATTFGGDTAMQTAIAGAADDNSNGAGQNQSPALATQSAGETALARNDQGGPSDNQGKGSNDWTIDAQGATSIEDDPMVKFVNYQSYK